MLDLPITDAGLRNIAKAVVSILQDPNLFSDTRISNHLVLPLFAIGCVLFCPAGRALISALMARIAKERGKGNAALANAFLEELWSEADAENRVVKQADVNRLMSKFKCGYLWG